METENKQIVSLRFCRAHTEALIFWVYVYARVVCEELDICSFADMKQKIKLYREGKRWAEQIMKKKELYI